MVNYPVYSPHFSGSPQGHIKTAVAPEKIKSMQHLPLTVSSIPYGDSTNHFVNGKVVTVTSGNIFWTTPKDYEKYGFFSQLDDGVSRGNVSFPTIDDWKANGEINRPNLPENQPIPNFYDITGGKVGGLYYIEGIAQLRLWTPDKNDTQVKLYTTPRLVEATDINSIGKRTSQVENLRQKMHRDLLFNDRNELHYEVAKLYEFFSNQ